MRLTLELLTGPETGAARVIDGSRTFLVGTRSGATWHLSVPAAADALLRIRHEAKGFLAEAEGDVTIEGAPAGDGRPRSIGHGSRFTIAGIDLRATIAQAPGTRPGIGMAGAPSVTAILADVTPGGELAQGILPGRTGEEWLDELTRDTRPPAQMEWSEIGLYGATAPSPLGPVGPAEGSAPRLATFLPDDWDAPSDSQNRVTQFREPAGAAPRVGKAKAAGPAVLDPAIRAFLRAADILPEEIDGPLEAEMAGLGQLLHALQDAIQRIETAQARVLAEFDTADGLSRHDASSSGMGALLLTGGDVQLAAATLVGRADRIIELQNTIVEGARACLSEARRHLDPDAIAQESQRLGGVRTRLSPDAAAWALYKSRFLGTAPDQPVPPLDDTALARAIRSRQATGKDKEPSA